VSQFSTKFFSAVRTLTAAGPIKKRLISAYSDNLESLPKSEIPECIRLRFESLWRSTHSVKPLATEGSIVASVRKMSTTEATRCAASIVAMFSELVSDKATGEPLGTLNNSEVEIAIAQCRSSTLN